MIYGDIMMNLYNEKKLNCQINENRKVPAFLPKFATSSND